MITKPDAIAIALDYIRMKENPQQIEVVVLENDVQDFSWCWAIQFESKMFLETNNFSEKLIENPILVTKKDGQVLVMQTAFKMEHYVREYEKQGFGNT